MKITTLEQALGKRVKCTDGIERVVKQFDSDMVWFEDQDHESQVWDYHFRNIMEPLFLGGTVEEGE